jgi:hypothetical protein
MTEFAAALVKAQSQIEGAKKDSKNPHFKSSYADLASVWDACRDALHANGFSVIQGGELLDDHWVMKTTLLHETGQASSSYVPLLNSKGDMQGLGSAMTYARRYGLAAIVGVCPEDDDGNAASEKPAKVEPKAAPDGYQDWLDNIAATADEGTETLKQTWAASPAEFRAFIPKETWESIKARAAKVAA